MTRKSDFSNQPFQESECTGVASMRGLVPKERHQIPSLFYNCYITKFMSCYLINSKVWFLMFRTCFGTVGDVNKPPYDINTFGSKFFMMTVTV